MNSKMEDEQANKLQQRLYRSIFFLKRVKKLLHILLFAHFYSLNIKVMTFSTQFCTVWVKAAMPALSFQLGRVKSLSDTPDRVTEMFRGAVCTCWAACPASRECTTLTQLAVLTQGALPSSGTDRIFPHHWKILQIFSSKHHTGAVNAWSARIRILGRKFKSTPLRNFSCLQLPGNLVLLHGWKGSPAPHTAPL